MRMLLKKLPWKSFIMALMVGMFSLVCVADVLSGLHWNETSKLFPLDQELKGEVLVLGGTVVSPFYHKVIVDSASGAIKISTVSNEFNYSGTLNPALHLQESDFIFKNKEMIAYLGHDQRVTSYNEKKKVLQIHYFLNGQLKGVKEVADDSDSIDSDTLLIVLQGMLLKNTGNFTRDIIQKAKGIRVNADFKLVSTNDLQQLSPQYTFPEKFAKQAKQPAEVYVYVMSVAGVTRLLYPYKYYFAYQKDPPHSLIAYWGGAPKEVEYGYIWPQ